MKIIRVILRWFKGIFYNKGFGIGETPTPCREKLPIIPIFFFGQAPFWDSPKGMNHHHILSTQNWKPSQAGPFLPQKLPFLSNYCHVDNVDEIYICVRIFVNVHIICMTRIFPPSLISIPKIAFSWHLYYCDWPVLVRLYGLGRDKVSNPSDESQPGFPGMRRLQFLHFLVLWYSAIKYCGFDDYSVYFLF